MATGVAGSGSVAFAFCSKQSNNELIVHLCAVVSGCTGRVPENSFGWMGLCIHTRRKAGIIIVSECQQF